MQNKIQLTATLEYNARTALFGDVKEYIHSDIADLLFADTSDSLELGTKMKEAGYEKLADAWEKGKINKKDVGCCIYIYSDQTTAQYVGANSVIVFSVTYVLDLKELEELADIRQRQKMYPYNNTAERFEELLKKVVGYTARGNTKDRLKELTRMGFEEPDLRYFGFKDQDLDEFYKSAEDEQSITDDAKCFDPTLEDLNLSVRAYTCLKRNGIETVFDIIRLKPEGLRNVRNLGRKAYMEVVNAIRNETGAKLLNWELKDDEPVD